MTSRSDRFAPLTGVVFAVLVYVSIALTSGEPDADAGAGKIVEYWTDNDGKEMATSVLGVVAVVLFVWFAGSLRSRLREAEGGTGRLAHIAWAGALLFATGLLLFIGLSFVIADTVDDLPTSATLALNALNSDLFLPAAGGGAILYLGTGAAALRTGVLPKWLGWLSIVLGVVALTPAGFVPFLALGLWVAIVAVLLYRQAEGAAGGPVSG